jgi:signal transduction histidine kinase
MRFKGEKLVVCTAALLAVAQIAAALVCPRCYGLTFFGDLTQTTLLVIGTWTMYVNARQNRGRVRFFWTMMAIGFALWTASQLMWTYYEVLARQEVPNPFIGDVVIFIHLVPMMGALTLQMQSSQDERSLRLGSLDVVLLLFWWLYLYVFTVIPWQYVAFDETRYGHSFNALYLAEHLLFMVGLGYLYWKRRDNWKKIYGNLLGAALLYGFAFYAADVAIDLHRYYTGSVYDIPLVASMAAFVWVGVVGRQVTEEAAEERTAPGPWAARLAMAAMLSMPLLAFFQEFATDAPNRVRHFRILVTLVGMFLLGLVVFLKQHLLTQQLAVLLRRAEESLQNTQRLQSHLVQSEKMAALGQLVAGAAHEINNPLTAILGFSEMLALEKQLTPSQEDFVEKIRRQAQRTKELVANMLDFARPSKGQKGPLEVNALVQTAMKLSQTRMQRRSIRAELDLGLTLPSVHGDKNQLLQVVLHLLRNAVDAMEAHGAGVLRIMSRAENGEVLLEFSDSGTGLKAPERVFDPFYTTKAVGQGTGLGLSACYGIVQEHHGSISCWNRNEGGATFQVRLPAVAADGNGDASAKSAVAAR